MSLSFEENMEIFKHGEYIRDTRRFNDKSSFSNA